MKNYLLLLSTCFIFANNQYPTESQINQMIEQSMQLIWETAMEFSDLDSSRYGIEERYPFFDRRIMEFCLAVPGKYRIKDGKTRYYFRQAMEGYLDNEILNRFSKECL